MARKDKISATNPIRYAASSQKQITTKLNASNAKVEKNSSVSVKKVSAGMPAFSQLLRSWILIWTPNVSVNDKVPETARIATKRPRSLASMKTTVNIVEAIFTAIAMYRDPDVTMAPLMMLDTDDTGQPLPRLTKRYKLMSDFTSLNADLRSKRIVLELMLSVT